MFCVISIIGDKLAVKYVTGNFDKAEKSMKNYAVEYVHYEIGKKNYVNTLTPEYSGKSVSEYPEGLILKKCDENEIISTGSIKKIQIWRNTRVSGWVSNSMKSEYIGHFGIYSAESAEIPETSDITEFPEKTQQKNIIRKNDKLIDELKQYIREKNIFAEPCDFSLPEKHINNSVETVNYYKTGQTYYCISLNDTPSAETEIVQDNARNCGEKTPDGLPDDHVLSNPLQAIPTGETVNHDEKSGENDNLPELTCAKNIFPEISDFVNESTH